MPSILPMPSVAPGESVNVPFPEITFVPQLRMPLLTIIGPLVATFLCRLTPVAFAKLVV
jgi:hypothetical protein